MFGRLTRSLIVASGFALAAAPSTARAQQVDTNPPLPNVLLLIDNSGSMDRMIDAGTQESESPCNCTDNGSGAITCNWTGNVTANRWNTLIQALTGPLPTSTANPTFNCVAMNRNAGTTFASEYQIGGAPPYDINYYLPFHRMVAYDPSTSTPTACVYAPGYLPGGTSSEGVGPNNLYATGTTAEAFPTATQPAIVTRPYGAQSAYGNTNTTTCNFNQLPTGAIATMSSFMRFGLMTFDSDPAVGIGVTTGSSPMELPIASGGPFAGMWTYYQGWSTGAACPFLGKPGGCATSTPMGVGARNPCAPPWEGRMVDFPTTNATADQAANNGLVSQALLAMRPYGATPLAGLFRSAQYFFGQQASLQDMTTLPGPPSTSAPALDPLVTGGCRSQYVILMTDGGPNLDMQTGCGNAGSPSGICPFALPYAPAGTVPPNTPAGGTAAALYNAGNVPSVRTFVIGFAVSSDQTSGGSTLLGCEDFAKGNSLSSVCDCTNPNLPNFTYGASNQLIGPCCVLQCIAQNGGPPGSQAYFADNAGDLNTALGQILASITKSSTTRTTPSYSPVVNSQSTTDATATFLASFNPTASVPTTPNPGVCTACWTGDVQRQRYACTGTGLTMQAQAITNTAGDDFTADMLTGSPARTFIAFEAAATQPNGLSQRDSTATIRPYVATNVGDGIGQYTAATFSGPAASVIGSGSNTITPDALGVTSSSSFCQYRSTTTGAMKSLAAAPNSPSTCMQMLLDFTFAAGTPGVPGSGFTTVPDFSFASRAGTPLGDVLDAQPAVVGAPGSLVQDPSYEAFQANWANVPSPNNDTATPNGPRKQVVYVATNDGLLHAFWAGVGLTSLTNNELWAMLPPAVMPNIGSTYPSAHAALLDGSPVVKDVVWDRAAGANDGGVWRTTLVAGYGPSFPGYYAVDITNPVPAATVSGTAITDDPPIAGVFGDDMTVGTAIPKEGPVFRWQITKIPTPTGVSTAPFQFIQSGATPAVTTLYMDPGDGNGKREIGVAILPGGIPTVNGIAITPTAPKNGAAGCLRAETSDPSPPGYAARTSVNCWGATGQPSDPVPGRAVSIVRLDTGEILRVFGRYNTGGYNDFPATDQMVVAKRVTNVTLDSPMTGTPIVYPTEIGTDATKFFISDADGTIWRFDVSDPNPANWSGQLFLDLYNQTVDPPPGFTPPNGTSQAWADGQPVVVPPVLSLDNSARLVLNVATGAQSSFTNQGNNFVYSITEVPGTSSFQAQVNWYLNMTLFQPIDTGDTAGSLGSRVSGPMTVFNGNLYFSSFAAPASTTTCTIGTALLWGMNFNTAATGAGQGGTPAFTPPSSTNIQDNYNPFSLAISATGVIPGVSILGTPSCVAYPTNPTTDQYVAGAMHYSPSQYTAPATPFALNVQIGGTASKGAQSLQIALPTPTAPTLIDSWAAILE
jgi:type IV pilus assembly protein PilY1